MKVLFEFFFVLLVIYLHTEIYPGTGHLIENFGNDWHLTTTMLELSKLGR